MNGTYILIVRIAKGEEINVGRLGAFFFRRGYYLYVGSAFGPGGVNARIRRHLRSGKKQHWHIDYLTSKGTAVDVWFACHEEKHECVWAEIFEGVPSLEHPVPGFGASDCSCGSHLFYSRQQPLFSDYRNLLYNGIKKWDAV